MPEASPPVFEQFQETPAKPLLACDLIMKGGITSGVVYPAAVIELAKRYRFRGIGGASAGAIAAAGAAAAELGRDATRPGAGFVGLHQLQAELTQKGKLLELFEPDGGTHPFFELFTQFLGGVEEDRTGSANKPKAEQTGLFDRIRGFLRSRIDSISGTGLHIARAIALMAVLLVAAGVVGIVMPGTSIVPSVAIAIGVLLLIGAFVAARKIGSLVVKVEELETKYGRAYSAFKANRYGISTGFNPTGTPRLTNFLHAQFNALAGLDPHAVLTFAMLAEKKIQLRLMSSNLSLQSPHVFPLSKGTHFLFKRAEFERLFPKEVVEAMTSHPINTDPPFPIADAKSLFFLPPADDLPVIVAVRCSLAHPGLFSAVPVFALTQKQTGQISHLCLSPMVLQ